MEYIVFDLEATCWPEGTPGVHQEIIEIGALRISREGRTRDQFQSLVRPVIHPHLSPYCKMLTGIQQEELDNASMFPRVLDSFVDWLFESDDYLLLSWGARDRHFLLNDCDFHRQESDWLEERHFDLKALYKEMFRLPGKLSLNAALRREGLCFDGDAHRALDDARNTAELFRRHIDMWPLE
jgi:inhibitor of KinA sporulation pathway (predicted exonuclease)